MESRLSQTSGFDATRVMEQTRRVGRQLVNQQVDQRSTLLGKQVSDTAQALRDVGSDLHKRGQARYVADVTDAVAKYFDRFGRYLQDSDATTLGHDFETLARRQPIVVGALALVGGFISSRVIRVSSTHRPPTDAHGDIASKTGSTS